MEEWLLKTESNIIRWIFVLLVAHLRKLWSEENSVNKIIVFKNGIVEGHGHQHSLKKFILEMNNEDIDFDNL